MPSRICFRPSPVAQISQAQFGQPLQIKGTREVGFSRPQSILNNVSKAAVA